MTNQATKDALADLRQAVKLLAAIQVLSDTSPQEHSPAVIHVQALVLRALQNLKPQEPSLPLFDRPQPKEETPCQEDATSTKSPKARTPARTAG